VTVVILLVSVLLAAVAAAGVLWPFGRVRTGGVDQPVDPLEEERDSLLRALRDLDEERAVGGLPEAEYRALRTETAARTVSVLRALEARDGAGELSEGLAELRPPSGADGDEADPARTARRRRFVAAGVAAAIVAVVVPLLAGAVANRQPGGTISGNQSATQNPLSFYEARVKANPGDPAARLDLAQRYLEVGDVQDAVAQYLAVLKIEPNNAEARATLGFLLYKAGKPQDGLDAVMQALRISPKDPEALYFEGVILLDGLHRPADAAAAFREYLDVAPFGSRRAEVQGLLAKAEAGATPTPSP
jgi:tetratricopeptide (TPR) repeat protein